MRKNDMGKDEIPKLILRLAIPTMLAQFVNVLYSIVDRMFIGHIAENGNLALAGVGVCGPIVAVLVSFAYLVGQGGTPLMAMQMGAGDKKSASEIVSNCFRILLILGFALTCVFLLLRRQFLWWFGASEATFSYALTYLTIYICGTIFALISGGMNSFLIAQGRSDLGMGTVLIGTILNVVLDPIFIFIFKMGVAGAAWATILSQAFSAIFALYCLRKTNLPVRLVWEKFRPDLCKKVLSLGFAPFLTYALDSTLLIILNATLQRTGGHGEGDILVMSTAIIQSYMLLITSPLGGITLGCQGVVSYNLGAGDYKRVKKALWCVYFVCLSFCTVILCVTMFASPYFVRLFTPDQELVSRSVTYIKIYAAGVLGMAAQWTVTDMGTALGQRRMTLFCSLVRKGIYVAGVLLLPILFTPAAAFAAQPLCDIVGSMISIFIFFRVLPRILATQKKERSCLTQSSKPSRASQRSR